MRAAENLTGRPDLSGHLEPKDRDYLAGCRAAESAATRRKQRMQAVAAGLVLLFAAGCLGWLKQDFLREQYYWHFVMGPTVLTAAQERALKPKEEFIECAKGCPTMVVIPAGKFIMGSGYADAEDREQPEHEVAIGTQWAVGKYEVTFAEWDACVAAGSCPHAPDSSWGRGNRPVINVSWDDAKKYVTWMSRITGKTYRLLTESEWEFAVRGGTQTRFFFGNDEKLLAQYAWYNENTIQDDLNPKTNPVGRKRPNAFGLYDMLGNVQEWVEDVWHESYEGAPSDGSAWTQGGDSNARMTRGGSWNDAYSDLYSSSRSGGAADMREWSYGFRVARTFDQ